MIFEGEYINNITKELEHYLKDDWFDSLYFRPYILKEYGNNTNICFRVPGYTVGEIELNDNIIIGISVFPRAVNAFKVDCITLENLLSKYVGSKFEWGELWTELAKDFDEEKR